MSSRPAARSPRSSGLLLIAALVALMWAVEIADLVLGDLDGYGIRPRTPDGLLGVATAPVLHSGFVHLIGNTVPFLVLGATIALGGLVRVATVTAIVAVVSGLGTWLVAAPGTVHIGASGLVFGYATYLIARGVYSRRPGHLGLGLIVLFVYGTTLLFGLVPAFGVSWSAHAFGALGGLLAAWVLHRRAARRSARLARGG